MIKSETIAAIATGMSDSGIGIVRISGDDAFSIASLIFKTKSGNTFNNFESHRVYYGYIFDGDKPIDEVLTIFLKAPKSFTTEDTVEINCHGGLYNLNRVLDVCLKNGCRLAEKGEFTKRAFLGGRIDLSEAEAVIDIINSNNELSLNNSVNQLRGNLYNKIKDIRKVILNETAYIEAALDDPEHYSLDNYSNNLRNKLDSVYKDICYLVSSYNNGKIISEGINTCILGKPNVGKSSLLNVLIGEDRAIVTNIAGTTRDSITEKISLSNVTLNITDTAGIRDTDDLVEKIGVSRAFKYADSADLIILVVDSSIELDNSDFSLFDYIKDRNAIILLNKNDLISVVNEEEIRKYSNKKVFSISAKNENGIDDISDYITKLFISGDINIDNSLVITNQRHKALLSEAKISFENVFDGIENGFTEDLIVIDLVNAYECLGFIIGESISDDVIHEVFDKFCMGK